MSKRFPYVTLHDLFPGHPKVAARSDAAFRVQVTGFCYSHQHSTDGFVPAAVAHGWGRKSVRELVKAGMWEEVEGGYTIHDYLDWNDSKAEIAAKSDSKRMAGAKGADSRWHGISDDTSDGGSHRERVSGSAIASDPVGLEVRKPKPRHQVYGQEFEAFWDAYPRHVGKRKAADAFDNACGRGATEAQLAAAARAFRDDPNRTEEFTPHPTTWLNRDGWLDDPLPERGTNGYVSPTDRLARRAMEAIRDRT